MGEIGIDRREFLYELQLWEINAIVKGYRRRHRAIWEAARWQSFLWMKARGAKTIHDLHDLAIFPWEQSHHEPDKMTDEEVEEMREVLRRENEKRK